MHIIRKAVSAAAMLCLCSCAGRKELPVPEYVRYMEQGDHAFTRTVKAGAYEYTIQLATPEFMACKQEEENSVELKERIAELQAYTFFLIKMGTTEKAREATGGAADAQRIVEADGMVAYYEQQAAGDISLKAGNETLQPATYHFEHNYGLAPHNVIVVAFKTGAAPQDMELVFHDRFRDIPHIKAVFNQTDLEKLPLLKL